MYHYRQTLMPFKLVNMSFVKFFRNNYLKIKLMYFYFKLGIKCKVVIQVVPRSFHPPPYPNTHSHQIPSPHHNYHQHHNHHQHKNQNHHHNHHHRSRESNQHLCSKEKSAESYTEVKKRSR